MSETLYYGNKNIAGLSNVTASAFYGTFVGSASQLTGIPTGPTGPQGTTGPTGITGPTGFTGPGYGPYQTAAGTSISPIVGGSVIVTLLTNLQSAFFVNQTVRVAINTSTYFDGIITNIAGLAYTIQVDYTTTASATGQWTFGLSGQRGAIGWTGPTGPAPTGSAGGVVYLTASQLSAATLPADLFWNNSNGRLGVKQSAPAYTLDVTGNARVTTDLTLGTALSVANGGTGVTTAQGAMNVFAGAVTSGSFLRGDGTNVTMSVIQNGDLPATISRTNIAGTTSVVGPIVGSNTVSATTITASGSIIGTHVGQIVGSNAFAGTTVTASGTISGNPLVGQLVGSNAIAGTTLTLSTAVSIANGGTGQTTKAAAFDALSPMNAQGDLIYGSTSGSGVRLAIGTINQVLHGGPTPTWGKVQLDGDVLNTLPIGNGGTGATAAQAAINNLVGTQTGNRVLRSDGTNMSLAQVGLTTDVTGALPILNGGTGQTTQQAAINALAGTPVNNRVLRSNGTDVTLSQVALGTDVSGALPILNGGTGQTTRQAALDALAGATTINRFLRGDGTNILLAQVTLSGSDVTGTLPVANGGTGQTSVAQNTVFAGPGGAAGAPAFRTLVSGDIPNNAANTSGSAASATNASFASSATNASFASSATNATSATNASFASSATNATFASSATNASAATNASYATYAGNSGALGGLTKSQLWNNSGQNHTTYPTFASLNSVDFGEYFAQVATDGPAGNKQYYVTNTGLGNDYAYSSYAMQTAIVRNENGYFWFRFRENGSFGAWQKIYAGFADSATNASSSTNATYATSAGSATNASNFSGGAINATTGTFSGQVNLGSSSFANENLRIQNNSGYPCIRCFNDTGGGGAFEMFSILAQAHGSNTSWGCNGQFSARFNASPLGYTRIQSQQQNGSVARLILDASPIQLSRLTTNGTLVTTLNNGTLSVSSDIRAKTNIEYLTSNVTPKLLALKPAYFSFKTSPTVRQLGFIAQDVEKELPEAVDGKKYEYEWKTDKYGDPELDDNGELIMTDTPRYRGLEDRAIIALLVKTVQELESRIRTLESRN